ncbi:MAG: hypothetical protein A2W72_02575 [Burkholderiales bacterium RIFCSPLOWO2_12_67_14]|nr:MAG: hypothetical protein A3I64_04780 [Burkholderiales bacterium RIFCSPLOWO2_02_FULL_67_64]OGB39855.1 MAG: hypothetical protein A3E51_18250 [Burkholderiales bacterium RIFCSPHIGHO2_12_FULL_67_38]OGB47731.1 MAG: hypothetical protein A2W72_02575 [Burkholderiales bacterium RIFCSPLOWO2_12_67_14]OGB87015.1 MAG: hypothetical protein A3G82_26890 [Burkholderiales bacterium RIFCSPLOWO2_12_FULL_67_210]
MGMDGTGLLVLLASGAVTFLVGRFVGRRYRARRAAQQAQRELAGQSRQVRRAQARKNRR